MLKFTKATSTTNEGKTFRTVFSTWDPIDAHVRSEKIQTNEIVVRQRFERHLFDCGDKTAFDNETSRRKI